MSKIFNNKKEFDLFRKKNAQVIDLLKFNPVSDDEIEQEIKFPSYFKKVERKPRKKKVKDYRPELDSIKKYKKTFAYISDDADKIAKIKLKLDSIVINDVVENLEEKEKYGKREALIYYLLYFNNVYKYKEIGIKFQLINKLVKKEIKKKIDFELDLHKLISIKQEINNFKLMAFQTDSTFIYDLFCNEKYKLQSKFYDEDLNRIFINSESQNYNNYIHLNIIPETVLRDPRNKNNLEIDMVKEALYDYSLKCCDFGSDDESLPFGSEDDLT